MRLSHKAKKNIEAINRFYFRMTFGASARRDKNRKISRWQLVAGGSFQSRFTKEITHVSWFLTQMTLGLHDIFPL